jgi:hypothetical protein
MRPTGGYFTGKVAGLAQRLRELTQTRRRARERKATIANLKFGQDFKGPCPPLIKVDEAVTAKVGKLFNPWQPT